MSVPPLRTRRDDIPELTRHFLTRIAAEEGKRIRSISAHGLALLAAYHWPGNVRQLENAIFRAVVLADGDEIGANEFPQIAALVSSGADSAPPLIEPSPAIGRRGILARCRQRRRPGRRRIERPAIRFR